MKIKVCGLNNPENIVALSKLKIDFMGFIFYKKSVRYFNNALSFDEARQIPKSIKKVGVFVNEPLYDVLNTTAHFDLDIVQLHGNETVNYCKELMPYVKIIKTCAIGDSVPTQTIQEFNNVCDYFLFDTACANYGGSGKTFDWQILNAVSIDKPFFISGGINPQNYNEVKKLSFKNLIGLDLNSGFELSPGVKDTEKINQTINQTHANEEKE